MPHRLHVLDGADKGRQFNLPEAGVVTVGSSRKHADIALNDLYVARIHCQLELQEGRIIITDNDSSSGTLVNGQKIRQQDLATGDVLRLGNSQLRLELEEAGAAADTDTDAEEDVPEVEVEVLPEMEPEVVADEVADEESEQLDVVEVASDDEGEEHEEDALAPAAEADAADSRAPPASATPSPIPHLPREHLHELCGHNLGHYELQSLLGKGHVGVVFQALDQKDGKHVALKVLSAEFPANEDEMRRFVQVMKVLLPLRHPNLVSLQGGGKTGPYCWIAMELVPCDSLSALIDALARIAKIDWHRPYRIAVHVTRALDVAHKHHLQHGNITPRHILWNAGSKVAKLADLGLAAALQGSAVRKITVREKIDVELPFLSPEQTQQGHFVGGVCDLFSLGTVIYALLTGRLPFAAQTQAETVRKLREATPAPPSSLQPGIPPRFERIVLRMLAKNPNDRFPSPAHLLAELQKLGEEHGISA